MPRQIANTKATAQMITTPNGNSMGFLNFWTLPETKNKVGGHLPTQALVTSAKACGLPQWMTDRIAGRTPKSAWIDATQLGAKGVPSMTANNYDAKDTTSRYLVRDANEEARVLVRETISPSNERVNVVNVAVIYFIGPSTLTWDLTAEIAEWPKSLVVEAEGVLSRMKSNMDHTIGLVNVGRIRTLLLDWLVRNHRICVRGTGGVYLIPRPKDGVAADMLIAEIVSIQNWVKASPLGGLFSVVELFDSANTSKQDFIEAAIEEIMDEAREVDSKLKKWQGNSAMNDGSRAYSSGEMVTRLDQLTQKVDALKDALGDTLGVAEEMVRLVRGRAQQMCEAAGASVASRQTSKDTVPAIMVTKTAPAAPVGDLVVAKEEKKGRTGTARQRKEKVTL